MVGGEVALLARIGLEIEELRGRRHHARVVGQLGVERHLPMGVREAALVGDVVAGGVLGDRRGDRRPEELPASLPDRGVAVGHGRVAGALKAERPLGETRPIACRREALEQRQQVCAVERLRVGGGRKPAGGEHRRQPVAAVDGRVDEPAGGDLPGPGDDARHADALLEHVPLAAAEGPVEPCGALAGNARPDEVRPVVAREHDERAVADARLVDGREQPADARVHLLDHRGDDRQGAIGPAGETGGVCVDERLRGLERRVDRRRGKHERERPPGRRGSAHERRRLVGEHVAQVPAVVRLHPARLGPAVRGGGAPLELPALEVVGTVGEADEVVESAAVGEMVVAVGAVMPLADVGGGVARGAEVVADRAFGAVEPIDAAVARHVDRPGAVAIAAGEDRGPGGGAERRRRITGREPHALPREPIDRGRVDVGIALAAEVAEADVVGEDENYVCVARTRLGGGRGGQKAGAECAAGRDGGDGRNHDDGAQTEAGCRADVTHAETPCGHALTPGKRRLRLAIV